MNRSEFLKKSALLAGSALVAGEAMGEVMKTANTRNSMKIVVLTGSPRKNGNTAYLADQFIKGAEERGHVVTRFDCAFLNVAGCNACNHCGMNGPCVFKDDFERIRPKLIEADLVAFVSPMYYFGVSEQLKRVIDRFYAINGQLKGRRKKAAFLMAYANTAPEEAEPMLSHYRTLVNYLGWTSVGTVVAPGVWTAGSIKRTNYGEEAYRLGKSLA